MEWSRVVRDELGEAYVRYDEAMTAIKTASEAAVSLHTSDDLWMLLFFGSVGVILLGMLVAGTVFTVQQQSAEIIERFGKFHRIARPGFRFKIPLIEQRVWEADLRISALGLRVETKTQDDVFVDLHAAVQYAVMPDKIYEAYYMLADDEEQLKSYVFDVIRGRVPKMKLDEAFAQKDEIAQAVKEELTEAMSSFGYTIHRVLVTDIEPDTRVKQAMNEINAAQRERMAATERGEAERILAVKRAEADKQSNILSGEGLAGQRKAIIDGLRESVEEFQKAMPGTEAKEVMSVVLMTQYFDTLKQMGGNGRVIFTNHAPGAVNQLSQQIQEALEGARP